jgi:hypothetical protein
LAASAGGATATVQPSAVASTAAMAATIGLAVGTRLPDEAGVTRR